MARQSLGIRGQLIGMVATALVVSIVATGFFIRDLVYDNILDQKITTADILTASIVHDVKYEYNYRNRVAIENILSKYLTYYRIINNIHYYALDSSALVNPDVESVTVLDSVPVRFDRDIDLAIQKAKPSVRIESLDDQTLSIRSVAPVLQGSRVIGAVSVNISIDDIQEILSAIYLRIFYILVIVTLIAATILYAFLRTSLLFRLTRLILATREISTGNYSIKLKDDKNDELGELSNSFNQMTEELYQSKLRIDNHNQIMDQKITDATAELKVAYEELKSAQGQIVLSEKMASLGVLISGIAHEINTPVGAISNISRHLDKKVRMIPALFERFDPEKWKPLEMAEFVSEVITCSANVIDSIPSFKETRALESLLKEHGIVEWREKARILASLHFNSSEKIEKFIDCIRSDAEFELIEILGYIAHAARISETSTRKIHDIIHALKFYAYTDKGKVEPTQINESINTSLVLMNNRIKHAVTIYKCLEEDLPIVQCSSEIHQIWTVLLNNALDAIEQMGEGYDGYIAIKSYSDGGMVHVEVKDNGGGIPENVVKNIFDPFFTTKDIGKGTGLGLSIVSGIVKKHGGSIQVNTHNEQTTFTVSIPLQGITSDENKLAAVGEKE